MHRIDIFTGGLTQTNGYVIHGPQGPVLIDAPEAVAKWLLRERIAPVAVLLTHQHFDHVIDAAALQAGGGKLHAFAPYATALTLEDAAREWGLPISIEPFTIDEVLAGRTTLEVGGLSFRLAHVPGHSPDSLVYHLPEDELVFCGDTVFAGSIGRTDLPGHGDHRLLLQGIDRDLLSLPDATRLYPGHGPSTRVGIERVSNPFLT